MEIYPQLSGEGNYGKVRFGKLVSFQQKVVVKELSVDNVLDVYVEAKVMQVLNGHKSFPMLLGWIKEINSILFEYIGDTAPVPIIKKALNLSNSDVIKKFWQNWRFRSEIAKLSTR